MSARVLLASVALLLAACGDKSEIDSTGTTSDPTVDDDHDGWTEEEGDCEDDDFDVNPGADERCDLIDNDCDGEIDEDDAVDAVAVFTDADGDGYGDPGTAATACDAAEGQVTDGTDCDDSDDRIHPWAGEVCDELDTDEDCNGLADDEDAAVDRDTWLGWAPDADGDGYGEEGSLRWACDAPEDHVGNELDCDDSDPEVNPELLWYTDADGDGFGDPELSQASCEQPAGAVREGTDCDDADASSSPDSLRYLDGDGDGYGDPDEDLAVQQCEVPEGYSALDSDCDDADPERSPQTPWYVDADGDGFGDAVRSVSQCTQPTGFVADDTDCDDADAKVNPDTTWYMDTDGDGYGDPASTAAGCTQPSGYVYNFGDCDDSDPDVSPATLWYADTDGDGYGDPGNTTAQCTQPSGYLADDSDCDDADADLSPETLWYADDDSDGYGDPGNTTAQCTQPTGYTDDARDCDDTDASLSPETVWYVDMDGDGFGFASGTTAQCTQPSGYVDGDTDCDDDDANTYPGAPETCHDGLINDCNGTEADAWPQCPRGWTGTVDSSEAWLSLSGASEADHLDAGLVADLDGDGTDDFITSSSQASSGDGAVWLFTGPLTADLAFSDALAFTTSTSGARAGAALAVGDRDGDGYEDLLVGAPDGGADQEGLVWVLYGPLTGGELDSIADITWTGDPGVGVRSEAYGAGLALHGDADGDGVREVLLGDPLLGTADRGYMFVVDSTASESIPLVAGGDGEETYEEIGEGRSLMGLSDLDGDGYEDVAQGVPFKDLYGTDDGAVFLYEGPLTGVLNKADWAGTLSDSDGGDGAWLGHVVEGGADLDGDGVEDLVIGSPYANMGATSGGRLSLWLGGSFTDADLSTDAQVTIDGTSSGALLGGSVALGDLDQDGAVDLVVGSGVRRYGEPDITNEAGADAAWIFYGPLTGSLTDADADATLTGDAGFGAFPAITGDVGSDGYDDLLMGVNGGAGADEWLLFESSAY